MTTDAPVEVQPDGPAVRTYWLLCLGALFAMTIALAFRMVGAWAMLPIVVACLSLAGGWRSGPFLTLLALGWVLISEHIGLSPLELVGRFIAVAGMLLSQFRLVYGYRRAAFGIGGEFRLTDLVLVGACLLYCVGHYRLVGLTVQQFPSDGRPRRKKSAAARPEARLVRSDQSITVYEILSALIVPVWALVALLVWTWLLQQESPIVEWPSSYWRIVYPSLEESGESVAIRFLSSSTWRSILLIWLLGTIAIVSSSIIGYLSQRRMTSAEAGLYLSDVVWRETCREQRILNRFIARARLRQRRKEKK